MVVPVFLTGPVLYGFELFLASALITQIAVSLAAVIVSSVTIYFCRQKLVYWHQERVLRRRGRWISDVNIRSSRKRRDGSESSESELSDPSLLRRLRAGLRSRSHDRPKTKTSRETPGERELRSSQRLTSEDSNRTAPESGRGARPKLTKQVGAMHRSHWVAKPQQSQPAIGGVVRRRSSDSDAELRGRGPAAGSDRLVQEEPNSLGPTVEVEVVLLGGGKATKRSRATAKMTLKKHPRFSSSDSSSSASPASSSAESDDLVHGESTDNTVQTRRVPSIQVEPIVEERIVPLGRRGPVFLSSGKLEESTGTEISTLEFSLTVVEAQVHQHLIPDATSESAEATVSPEESPFPSTTDASAVPDEELTNKDAPGHPNVPSIYASDTVIHEGRQPVVERRTFVEQTEPRQHRQDTLGVPPILAGEEAYPEAASAPDGDNPSGLMWVSELAVGSSQRPLVLESKLHPDGSRQTGGGDSIEIPSLLAEDDSNLASSPNRNLSSPQGEGRIGEGNGMDSLDVPPIITAEVCFPSLMQAKQTDQNSNGHTASARKIIKIRPKSLDIPPMLPAPYPRNASSAPPSPPSGAGHGVKRKHSSTKSILKRSGSMERPGRKKSVSFSPEVSPQEFERCYRDDADRERGDSAKRPRVFRHFSMDIPDAKIAPEEDMSPLAAQAAWSHGDLEDTEQPEVFSPAPGDGETGKLSRAEGWVHPSALEHMQIEGSDSRMAFVPIFALEVDEIGRKSAKERFLEAGGAKAVLSVLCTQDSSDSNGSKYTPSSTPEMGAEAPAVDGSEEDSMETMPDVYQQVSVSTEIEDDQSTDESSPLSEEVTGQDTNKLSKDQLDGKGIKTRFLEDSADIHTSWLFVQTVRSSVESDSSDEQDRSPALQLEARGSVAGQDEPPGGGDDEDQATSAKSRFLQSCQEADGDNESPNGSRFVVSVVRPYTAGSHKQDSPTEGDSQRPGPKPNRKVPDGNNDNTWQSLIEQELTDDIEFYPPEPKVAECGRTRSVPPKLKGDLSPSSSSESEADGKETGASSRHLTRVHHPSISYTENTAVVIDNGSEVLKVGFAGDLKPRYTLPSVVGRYPGSIRPDTPAASKRAAYIGCDATERSSVLSLQYPSSEGAVNSWDDLEEVWEHVYASLLTVAPQEHPVLMSEYASTSKKQRGKFAEILFEKLQVPSLCLVNQGALALHSQGETAGIVLSSGGGLTEVIPVLDGCTLQYAVTTLKVAGKQITRHLGNLLQSERGYDMTSSAKLGIAKDIKETMAYVCMDFEREMQRVKDLEPLEYILPDGCSLAVGHRELVQCTEQLFQPDPSVGDKQVGVHDMIQETLKRCNPTVLAGIRKSILLAGGNTQLRGFGDRLQRELVSAHLPWSVSMPQERTHSVWVGGSVVAAHGDFSRRCVSAEEYAERGVPTVHARCF